ncbi:MULTISPECIES: hypothetical protein [Lactococcus]|uniref:hypothetical protein n=1 Tax=Lactococcus TaxID=1357 RepID=UPI00204032DE|nr:MULTISPECIES: hypothetical protein [Lactococcus]
MKNTLRQEISYLMSSKTLLVGALLLILLLIFGAFQAKITQTSSVMQFKETQKVYNSEQEFENDLHKPYSLSQSTNGQDQVDTSIENSARYSYESLMISNNQMSLLGFPKFFLKYSGLIFLPIISGFLGIFVATYDYKSATYKRKLNHNSWQEILVGKYLVIISVLFIALVFTTLISLVIGGLSVHFIESIDVSKYGSIFEVHNSLLDLAALGLTVFLMDVITAVIWFTLSLIIKSSVISIVLFLLYDLVLPNFGKYDFKNGMMNVFSNVGKDVITQPVPLLQIPFLEAWGILIVHVLLALGIGWGIFYKKTRFTL